MTNQNSLNRQNMKIVLNDAYVQGSRIRKFRKTEFKVSSGASLV